MQKNCRIASFDEPNGQRTDDAHHTKCLHASDRQPIVDMITALNNLNPATNSRTTKKPKTTKTTKTTKTSKTLNQAFLKEVSTSNSNAPSNHGDIRKDGICKISIDGQTKKMQYTVYQLSGFKNNNHFNNIECHLIENFLGTTIEFFNTSVSTKTEHTDENSAKTSAIKYIF